jgi:tellurite resistance-related uncharacterized protein
MTDQLPAGLEHVRTTETFDHEHHPAGLRRAHRVAEGVWARLAVYTGELAFVFEDEPDHIIGVTGGGAVVIPPGRLHHIDSIGPVTFTLEFHREADRRGPVSGNESTGLASGWPVDGQVLDDGSSSGSC